MVYNVYKLSTHLAGAEARNSAVGQDVLPVSSQHSFLNNSNYSTRNRNIRWPREAEAAMFEEEEQAMEGAEEEDIEEPPWKGS